MTTQQAREDRKLAPIRTAQRIGIPVRVIAAQMRRAGVTEPLDAATARRWRSNPDTAPDWFVELLAWKTERNRRRRRRNKQRAKAAKMRSLAAEQSAKRKVEQGKHINRFNDDERFWLDDWAFRLMKEAAYTSYDELDAFDKRIADMYGIKLQRKSVE